MELHEPQARRPAAYLKEQYRKALTVLKMTGSGGEKHPEVQAERVWDDIVKKLQQKEYSFDGGTYGSQGEFVKKVAYFYHASIQGAGAYPGSAMPCAWWRNGESPRACSRTGSASLWASCSGACAGKIRGLI